MKRTALALALAAISCTAIAAPPANGPLDVRVTNPVVPVEVRNANPLLVQDVGSRRSPYQYMVDDITSSSWQCGTTHVTCEVAFPAVPSGKRLVLERVTALLLLQTVGGQVGYFALGSGRSLNANNVAILDPTFAGTGNILSSSQSVNAYFEAGQVPSLKIGTSVGIATANVSLHGYLVDVN